MQAEYREMGLTRKTWELIGIVLWALTAGMFHGPWIALSRSMKTFAPEVFLEIVDRMTRNMAPVIASVKVRPPFGPIHSSEKPVGQLE
jgi:hypothetical protein